MHICVMGAWKSRLSPADICSIEYSLRGAAPIMVQYLWVTLRAHMKRICPRQIIFQLRDYMEPLIRDYMEALIRDYMEPLISDYMEPLISDYMEPLVRDYMEIIMLSYH